MTSDVTPYVVAGIGLVMLPLGAMLKIGTFVWYSIGILLFVLAIYLQKRQ